MDRKLQRQETYTHQIVEALLKMMEENDILAVDFKDPEKVYDFLYALQVVTPAFIYSKFTDNNAEYLAVNQTANRMIMQEQHRVLTMEINKLKDNGPGNDK